MDIYIYIYIYIAMERENKNSNNKKPSKKGNVYQINAFILKRKRLNLKGLLIM